MAGRSRSAPLRDALRSDRVRLRRKHERGRYDRAALHAVLDAARFCHVGYLVDGSPFVTPTVHWRDGDWVYWHGSAASRMLRRSAANEVCLTVSMIDGYVLARSALNHSINYRSAMLLGVAEIIADPEEKSDQLQFFVESLFPGRWRELRLMTQQELKATSVMKMEIDEASVKVRTGPPGDGEEADHPVWAGILPIRTVLDPPKPAPDSPSRPFPAYLNALDRRS